MIEDLDLLPRRTAAYEYARLGVALRLALRSLADSLEPLLARLDRLALAMCSTRDKRSNGDREGGR